MYLLQQPHFDTCPPPQIISSLNHFVAVIQSYSHCTDKHFPPRGSRFSGNVFIRASRSCAALPVNCTLLTFESQYTHVPPRCSSRIGATPVCVLWLTIGYSHHLKCHLGLSVFKRMRLQEKQTPLCGPCWIPALLLRRRLERCQVLFFSHFERLGWHPNKRAVVLMWASLCYASVWLQQQQHIKKKKSIKPTLKLSCSHW